MEYTTLPVPGNPYLQYRLKVLDPKEYEVPKSYTIDGKNTAQTPSRGDKETDVSPPSRKRHSRAKVNLFDKGKEEEEEEDEEAPPKRRTTISPVFKRDELVVNFENQMDAVTRSGAQPLFTALGMVATRVGMKNCLGMLKYRTDGQDPTSLVVRGANTLEEYKFLNAHLGETLLNQQFNAYVDYVWKTKGKKKEEKLIGTMGCFQWAFLPPEMTSEMREQILESIFGPTFTRGELGLMASRIWIWEVFPSAIFHFILSFTAIGAFELALAEISRIPGKADFTLKELICSSSIADVFARIVAYHYLSASGGNAYPARVRTGGGGAVYNVSAGFKTREALTMEHMGAIEWFKGVYRMSIDKRPYERMIDESPEFAGKSPEERAAIKAVIPSLELRHK